MTLIAVGRQAYESWHLVARRQKARMRHLPAACSVNTPVVSRLFGIATYQKCFSTRASRLAVADGFQEKYKLTLKLKRLWI